MSRLSRLVLVRHGETVGESSIRFHGRTDVPLSRLGCRQAVVVSRLIPGVGYDAVISSPLRRAWKTALLAVPNRWVRLEPNFREIDFGRWEGLTKPEIAALDPELHDDWQRHTPDFDFPEGERRDLFRARVQRGLDRLLESGVGSAIVIAHKGVVRTLVESLTGSELDAGLPELGEVMHVSREPGGQYFCGLRSSGRIP